VLEYFQNDSILNLTWRLEHDYTIAWIVVKDAVGQTVNRAGGMLLIAKLRGRNSLDLVKLFTDHLLAEIHFIPSSRGNSLLSCFTKRFNTVFMRKLC
jgi:hypothetical protein